MPDVFFFQRILTAALPGALGEKHGAHWFVASPTPHARASPGAASPQSEWEQRSLAALQLCDKPGPEREREERWLEATGKGTGSECSYYGYTLILSSANSIEWPKVLDSRHKWHHWRLAPGAPNKASQYGSTKFPNL